MSRLKWTWALVVAVLTVLSAVATNLLSNALPTTPVAIAVAMAVVVTALLVETAVRRAKNEPPSVMDKSLSGQESSEDDPEREDRLERIAGLIQAGEQSRAFLELRDASSEDEHTLKSSLEVAIKKSVKSRLDADVSPDVLKIYKSSHNKPLRLAGFAGDNALAVIAEGRVELVGLLDPQPKAPLETPTLKYSNSPAETSADGRWLIAAAEQPVVWNLATGLRRLVLLTNEHSYLQAMALDGTGRRAAIALSDTVLLWDLATESGREVAQSPTTEIHHAADVVTALALSRTGRFLAIASDDRMTRVHDLNGNKPPTLIFHDKARTGLDFSPDEELVLTVAAQRRIQVWNVHDGTLVLTARHPKRVDSACFDFTGERIASSCSDGYIRILDAKSGAELLAFRGASDVCSVRFSPDGSMLATSSTAWSGEQIVVWLLPWWHVQ